MAKKHGAEDWELVESSMNPNRMCLRSVRGYPSMVQEKLTACGITRPWWKTVAILTSDVSCTACLRVIRDKGAEA